jgi:hypothetical protein
MRSGREEKRIARSPRRATSGSFARLCYVLGCVGTDDVNADAQSQPIEEAR